MWTADQTLARIDRWYDQQEQGVRTYLGASQLGRECSREIWYNFRWAGKPEFEPRMLRLFDRGHREESVFVRLLIQAGVTYFHVDPATLKEYVVDLPNPHMGGHCDGIGKGLPELPEGALFVGEFKTHNTKSFDYLEKHGVEESKPEHYVQMQLYMHGLGIRYALYGAVCKNDDRLHMEIVEYEERYAMSHLIRGDLIAYAQEPPRRISNRPSWYKCKWCDFYNICHQFKVPDVNCRTCAHATPMPDGEWLCEKHGHLLSKEEQEAGCDDHMFLPGLLNGTEVLDVTEDYVELRLPDGTVIRQGPNNVTSEALCSYGTINKKP